MTFYLNGEYLFTNNVHRYTHAIMSGDRVICCVKSEQEAKDTAERIKDERRRWLQKLKAALSETVAYLPSSGNQSPVLLDIKRMYPTDAELYAAINRQKEQINSVKITPLTVK